MHSSSTIIGSSIGTTAPESLLIRHVQEHIRKGEAAKERAAQNHKKSEDHFIAAGRYLTMLKVSYAPTWQQWEDLLKVKVKLSTGRASELMQLADGRKDISQIRDKKAESVRQFRARVSSLQADVVKETPHDEEQEEPASIAAAPLAGDVPDENISARPALSQMANRDDVLRLIVALARSTPEMRNAAVVLLIEGVCQSQFEQVRTAVADLYQALMRAGR